MGFEPMRPFDLPPFQGGALSQTLPTHYTWDVKWNQTIVYKVHDRALPLS